MKLYHIFESVSEYDSVDYIQRELDATNRSLENLRVKDEQLKSNPNTPTYELNTIAYKINRATDKLQALTDTLEKAKGKQGTLSTRDMLYQRARHIIQTDLDGVTLQVTRGPKGGVRIEADGEWPIPDTYKRGRRGWGTYEFETPVSTVYIYPRGNDIWAYAPKKNKRIHLGTMEDIDAALKKFDIVNFGLQQGEGEVEGDIPD